MSLAEPIRNEASARASSTGGSDAPTATQLLHAAFARPRDPGLDPSRELERISRTPAFRAILGAVESLAREQAIPLPEAARRIVAAVRDADQVWCQVLLSIGSEALAARSQTESP